MTKDEMDREYELREQIKPLQAELWALEAKRKEDSMSGLIGKHFKYNNSYGSGERWWKYAKVISIKDGYSRAFSFEHTSSDKIEIELGDGGYNGTSHGWEEISEAEFKSAWATLQKHITKFAETAEAVK